MTPEEIQRKAEEERLKQEKLRAKKDADALEEIPQAFVPESPESWRIFNLIHLGFSRFPWVFAFNGLGFISLFMYWGFQMGSIEWLYCSIGFFSLAAIVFIQRFIRKRIAFKTFKTWRHTLPFALNGWEKIGAYKDFPQDSYWIMEAGIEIKLKSTSPEMTGLVSDALFLFTVEANKGFYEPDFVQQGFSGEIRKEWKMFKGDLSTQGSADGYVLGRIYVLCNQYLRGIHDKHGCIDAVNFWMKGKAYQVRRVQSD